ncbi:axonemal dynein light chain domain-containing protein 1 [Nematostella vectensis]|uniref:axonemal dynein light chain domain-containing protein 1 n=1 Tax=Nematostella vectensis TaxID=45351 RepID=UPI00138FD043|nr:axonemal dynein light chain domain-containing protein 1 [Nematostella vectensis]
MTTVAPKTSPSNAKTLREDTLGKTSRGKVKDIRGTSSPCILPVLDGRPTTDENAIVSYQNRATVESQQFLEKDQTFITAGSDFIPMDILNSLTQIPAPPTREQLGPPSKHKKLRPIEQNGSSPARHRPANVWNYPKGREKLKHLVEQPPCLCGAGKDISFLYDAVQEKQSPEVTKTLEKIPASVEREIQALVGKSDDNTNKKIAKMDGSSQIPDTLLPSEYHIVKNPGVMGLEFHDEKYTTYVHDHEDHLTVFPSMKPSGRQEVLKLKHAMASLLARAGADDDGKELTGPTQIHNLLELVKKEQNIYNVCFNEIIRQVTVECTERGELLADLRRRYSGLLDRIPRQVKSLHQEVIAQRALDRRLTEELVRFKASISALTGELASVKAHDREVTQQAIEAQRNLEEALHESEKNASLLSEYHGLYELQRNRLQAQIGSLTEERDLWGSAAYTLALKVTDKHSLNTAKKLHLCEKAWAKLARHFAIFLSEKDSIQLESLTAHVQQWREMADKFNKQIESTEDKMRTKLNRLVKQFERWKKEFDKIVNYDDGSVTIPSQKFISDLSEDMKAWEEVFNQEAERFTGEVLLAREDELYHMNKQVDKWTDVALKVFGRHQTPEGERWPQHIEMKELNQNVDKLHQQYHVRIIGENGVAKGIIDLVNPIETWGNKLNAILHGGEMMLEPEWIRLADLVCNEWLDQLKDTILVIGSNQKEGARVAGEPEKSVDVEVVVSKIDKWLTATTNGIDNEDGKIVEKVSLIHSAMVRWMITVLLRLAPDLEDRELDELSKNENRADTDSSIGGGQILLESTSEEIRTRGSGLFDEMRKFSVLLTKCCSDLVIDIMQERRDQGDEHADMEFKDLKRLTSECEGWVRTAELLTREVMGEDYEEPPVETTIPSKAKPVAPSQGGDTPATGDNEDAKSMTPESGVAISVEPSEEDKQPDTRSEGGHVSKSEEPQQPSPSPEPAAPTETPESPPDGEGDKGGEGESEKSKEKNDDLTSKMHVLGHDENIRTKSLEHLPADQELGQLEVPDSESMPARSPSPDTKKALEALAAVERLQSQLLETEERAQASEERALKAETELKQALERIRALERSASRASALTPGSNTPGSERPVSSSTSNQKRAESQTPASHSRSPSQQSTRASTRASTRKK